MEIQSVDRRRSWDNIELMIAARDISQRTEWEVISERHTLIVHRAGRINTYEGQIEGGPEGKCEIEVGNVCLIPAGRSYRSVAQGGRIAFSAVSFKHPSPLRPMLSSKDEFVHQAVVRMGDAAESGEDLLVETLGWTLSLHLGHRYGLVDARKNTKLTPRQKRRLEAYVESSLKDRPTVAHLAQEVGMGKGRFLAAFKETFKNTPAQYVLERRLHRAHHRLETSRREIGEIAAELGFASHSHLTTAFKRRYGIAPRDLRDGRPS